MLIRRRLKTRPFLFFSDGLLCFNTVVYELRDYQEEITELEKAGKWICFSKETLPFIATKGLPEERVWFVYKVLKN